jgi:hypothetical protein
MLLLRLEWAVILALLLGVVSCAGGDDEPEPGGQSTAPSGAGGGQC